MRFSIIIPVLNEESIIGSALQKLVACLSVAGRNDDVEVIVVDGGSDDESVRVAECYADCVLLSAPGRARQMNAGAAASNGDYLLFLHVDTSLPKGFFQTTSLIDQKTVWGFLRIQLSGENWRYRVIEYGIRFRSQLTHIATGDQCLFIKRSIFDKLGGFADIPLMEDIEMSKRLRRLIAPTIVKQVAITSSRRWQRHGILKTVFFMWWLRCCYFFGVSPDKLARKYYGAAD